MQRSRNEHVELSHVVALAVETAKPAADARNHELTVSLPEEPLLLWADPVRLAQVIANLLSNAAKYTEPHGHLWVTAEHASGRDEITIRVRDTGIGIDPEMLPRVFDLFTQAAPGGSGSQGGLGIGLTLVKYLVELSGGRVEASSEGTGKGSEFLVHLPLRQDTPSVPGTNSSITGAALCQKRRVLIVDDNEDAAQTLATLLTLHGHQVEVCHDGPSAIKRATNLKPDIVLLDIGMPGMDGLEVARRLRAAPATEGLFM